MVETLFRLFLGCCQVANAVWMTSPVVTWQLLAYEVSEAGGGGFVPCLWCLEMRFNLSVCLVALDLQ